MTDRPPPYKVLLAKNEKGGVPFIDFLESESHWPLRAKMMAKVGMVAQMSREEHSRPLIDTVDGPIKEIRLPDDQLRTMFTLDDGSGVMLVCCGERKPGDAVSPEIIEEAHELRSAWLAGRETVGFDYAAIMSHIRGRRIKWPTK